MNTLIKQIVADYFRITPEELMSKTRIREVVTPRQIYWRLSRRFTNYSLSELGENFAHCTVFHGINNIEDLINFDKRIARQYEILEKEVTRQITKSVEIAHEIKKIDTIANAFTDIVPDYAKLEYEQFMIVAIEFEKKYNELLTKLQNNEKRF